MVRLREKTAARVDRTVKTTESWWSFAEQLWEARAVFTPVLMGAGLLAASLASVFKWIAQFGWAGVVLALFPSFLVVALLGWALHWLWHAIQMRKIERRRTESATPAAISTGGPSELTIRKIEDAVRREFQERGGVGSSPSEITPLNSRLEQLESQMRAVVKKTDGVEKGLGDILTRRFSELHAEVEHLREQRRDDVRKTLVRALRESVERRLDWIDQGFEAIYTREVAHEFERKLDEGIRDISLPPAESSNHEWMQWEQRIKAWKQDLTGWVDTLGKLRPTLGSELNPQDSKYVGPRWARLEIVRFQNHEQIHLHKQFELLKANFLEKRHSVQPQLISAAFVKPSRKG